MIGRTLRPQLKNKNYGTRIWYEQSQKPGNGTRSQQHAQKPKRSKQKPHAPPV
jgi:hypothetical protein